MQNLLDFLRSQKVMALATYTTDPTDHPWIANVYYVSDEQPQFYFFGHTDSKWAKDIEQNPKVAFSVVWSNPEDPGDRKGIQAVGNANRSDEEQQLDKAIDMYSQVFPLDKKAFKQKVISGTSGLYVVKPSFVKHWDDAEHGDEKTKDYQF